jgi:hypothetical protein
MWPLLICTTGTKNITVINREGARRPLFSSEKPQRPYSEWGIKSQSNVPEQIIQDFLVEIYRTWAMLSISIFDSYSNFPNLHIDYYFFIKAI